MTNDIRYDISYVISGYDILIDTYDTTGYNRYGHNLNEL